MDIIPAVCVEGSEMNKMDVFLEKTYTQETEGREKIKKYQLEILECGLHALFLPVQFMFCDEKVIGCWDIRGFVLARELTLKDEEEMLHLLISLVEKVIQAENRYFFPEDYVVREDLLYIRKDRKDIGLLFEPGKVALTGIWEELGFIADYLWGRIYKIRVPEVGQKVMSIFRSNTRDLHILLHHLSGLQQDFLRSMERSLDMAREEMEERPYHSVFRSERWAGKKQGII